MEVSSPVAVEESEVSQTSQNMFATRCVSNQVYGVFDGGVVFFRTTSDSDTAFPLVISFSDNSHSFSDPRCSPIQSRLIFPQKMIIRVWTTPSYWLEYFYACFNLPSSDWPAQGNKNEPTSHESPIVKNCCFFDRSLHQPPSLCQGPCQSMAAQCNAFLFGFFPGTKEV